jgi:hypothetical protein
MWKCVNDNECDFVGGNIQGSPQICTCGGSSGHELCIILRCDRKLDNAQKAIKFECKYYLSKTSNCPKTSQNKIQGTNVTDNNTGDIITILQKGKNDSSKDIASINIAFSYMFVSKVFSVQYASIKITLILVKFKDYSGFVNVIEKGTLEKNGTQ